MTGEGRDQLVNTGSGKEEVNEKARKGDKEEMLWNTEARRRKYLDVMGRTEPRPSHTYSLDNHPI